MTVFLWLPILLSILFLVLTDLIKGINSSFGIQKSIKERFKKRIIVSKQLKQTVLFFIGFLLVYIMFYSVYNSFELLRSSLEGNVIIKPELKNVEINEKKGQNLLSMMLISYLALSTFFAGGFIKSVFKASVGLIVNKKYSK